MAKIIEIGVALGFDFNMKVDEMSTVLARRKEKNEERGREKEN